MKLVLAAPESFFALAVAAHPPPAAGALAAIAPLAAMSGAVLCDIANAEVDSARAAQRLSNCFMKISVALEFTAAPAATSAIGPQRPAPQQPARGARRRR